ncbi:helix-turn-helix domain-containing protein [Radicibacter daui]|uniref:helix-turn-helix domain-containing protein n=1 Tax=Radicibacter daui TaxID=3064829 RepID=UPI004046F3CB
MVKISKSGRHGDDLASAGPTVEQARTEVGRILREARQAQRMELVEAAQHLCIRRVHLEALENGDFSQLPSGPYIVGFVRSYGDLLGLDGAELAERCRREAGPAPRQQRLTFPEPQPEGRTPAGAVLLVAGIIGLVVYGGWYWFSSRGGSLKELTHIALPGQSSDAGDSASRALATATGNQPSVPQPATGSTSSATAGSSMVATSSTAPATTPVTTLSTPPVEDAPAVAEAGESDDSDIPPPPDTMDNAAPSATAEPAAPAAPSAATSAPSASSSVATVTASALPAPAAPAASAPTPPAAVTPAPAPAIPAVPAADSAASHVYGQESGSSRVQIRALQESWVQVRDATGNLLITRVLRVGDVYRAPDEPGLTMVTGNAGGLEVTVDGNKVAALGETGQVLRGVSLDADKLKAAR